jgi:protein-S-isoprenylcysteine O-methyltransferase Ste14
MGKLGGSGLLIAGIVIAFLGFVLTWDLIDWLIQMTGYILIVVGIILVIVGLVQTLSGKSGGSSMDY